MSAVQWLCRRAPAMTLLASPRIALSDCSIGPISHVPEGRISHPQLSKSGPFIPHFYFCAIASLWMSGVRTPNRGKMATFRLRSRVQYRINLCAYT